MAGGLAGGKARMWTWTWKVGGIRASHAINSRDVFVLNIRFNTTFSYDTPTPNTNLIPHLMSTTPNMTLSIPPALLPLLSLPPSLYIQSYFALLATGVLTLQLLPALQSTLLTYGPRDSPSKPQPQNPLISLLRKTGLLVRVPHAWFSHFYLALLSFQLFWAAQYLFSGSVLSAVAEREAQHGSGAGVSFGRVVLAWGMLTAQGARRLYECWVVMRPSASQMLGVHWVLSVLVYFGMSMAVWIEGSGTLTPSSS